MSEARYPILLMTDAGFGETPVPAHAFVQPGESLIVGRADRGGEACEVRVLAVCPVGTPLEYAIADQAIPKRPRPLMLQQRKPHRETMYVLQFPEDPAENPHLFPHSAMAAGYEKAAALNPPTEPAP